MHTSTKIIAVVAALSALIAPSLCACSCLFGEGKDVCSTGGGTGGSNGGKCAPVVVRPVPLRKLSLADLASAITKPRIVCKEVKPITTGGGILPFGTPVGDLCSCKQSIVLPAVVPQPPCNCGSTTSGSTSTSSSTSSSSSSSSSSCGSSSSGVNLGPIYVRPTNGLSSSSINSMNTADAISSAYEATSGTSFDTSSSPVDMVSLGIALSNAQQACGGADESKLAFGFTKLPVDVEKAVGPQAAEERLFFLNKPIMELKKVSCGKTSSNSNTDVDAEAMEALTSFGTTDDDIEEITGVASGIMAPPSYTQMGYGLAKPTGGKFITVDTSSSSILDSSSSSSGSTSGAVVMNNGQPCNDGFMPGNVIIKNTPIVETYAPSIVPAPLDCGNQNPLGYVKSFQSSSSTSSASNSNDNSQSTYTYTYM